jgi:hypothetical protein
MNIKGATMATRWKRSEEVIWEAVDGETVLVEPRTGRTWLLNAAAARIWRACDGLTRFNQEGAAFCRQLALRGLLSPSAPLSGAGTAVCFSGVPAIRPHGFGTGPRHRPSPRGLSGPG